MTANAWVSLSYSVIDGTSVTFVCTLEAGTTHSVQASSVELVSPNFLNSIILGGFYNGATESALPAQFSAYYAHFALYQRSFSIAELALLYDSFAQSELGLIALWTLCEGVPSTY